MLKYELLPDHCRDGMRLYVEFGIMPGSFLTAVLENNLVEAFACADEENIHRMFDYASFLYNEMPRNAWGSPKTVQDWAKARRADKP